MPIFLKRNEARDCLYLSIGKMEKAEFRDTLARVKATPGRRPNPEGPDGKFVWEFPNSPEAAVRLMTAFQPVADPEIESMVRAHLAEVQGQLVTQIGHDADDLKFEKADDLFPYQRAAVSFSASDKPKIILADEMGLGKTIEAAAIVKEFYARRPGDGRGQHGVLIICPKAVRGTWAHEVEKWADWDAVVIDGRTPAKRMEQLQTEGANCFIINWESFWRAPLLPELARRNWHAVIADEAHRAKNRKAKQTKGLFKLHAPVQIAATGTPIMNTPDELWSILHWLYPKAYTSFWAFHNSYVDEYIGAFNRRVMIGVKNPDELRFELRDKLVRRLKKDVLKDLPPKMPPQLIEVELTPSQRKLYEEAEQALFMDLAQWIKDEGLTEAQAEELADMPLDKLTAMIPNAGARIAKLRQITAAAKVEVAYELIREEPDTPVVAFTWHVEAARRLATKLADGPQGQRVGTIAGSDDADPIKDAFQKGDLDHVVCTIAKGGTGLTLTRSSNPILVEEDWTPAINDQAIDRTHRVGQTEPVTPRVLRCTGTVDDGRVAARNAFKRAVTAQVIGGS
jgi:SWI/SNF-related matrix-associated actin-dependent regulator 1 of chromatin subfamily A